MNSNDLRRHKDVGLWTQTGVAATFLTAAAAVILGIDGITETTKVTKTKIHNRIMTLWGDRDGDPGKMTETGLRVVKGTNAEGRTILTVDVEVPVAAESPAPADEVPANPEESAAAEVPTVAEAPVEEPVAELDLAA